MGLIGINPKERELSQMAKDGKYKSALTANTTCVSFS